VRGFDYAAASLLRGGLVSLLLILCAGLLGVAAFFEPAGLDLRAPRVLHTTFVAAWMVLTGLSVVMHWLARQAAMDSADRLRVGFGLVCFAVAGLGVLLTVPAGVLSGREYLGFHPLLGVPILAGWLAIAATFFRHAAPGLTGRPVYVLMWAVGFVFFTVTFCEQYLWLLPEVFADPIVDRRIQWKATGTLVGACNLFVYGAALYIGEQICGDSSHSRSRAAFWLFALGLLNSFVNFGHHTYHLPQSHLVKWIAFVVSMTEIAVLLVVLQGISCATRGGGLPGLLLRMSKWWTAGILVSAILMSVPPLNALIHGTYVVAGHAMGATIGIDTMVLLGVVAWWLGAERVGAERARRWVIAANVCAAAFALWLHGVGLVDGVTRLEAGAAVSGFAYRPAWLKATLYPGFAVLGGATALTLGGLALGWLPGVFSGRLAPLGSAGRSADTRVA